MIRTINVTTGAVTVSPEVAPSFPLSIEQEREIMRVSRFQAKAALAQAGLLETAEAAVVAAGGVAQLAWSEAVEFRRTSPTIIALAAAIGLTEEQIDDLFRTAAQITA